MDIFTFKQDGIGEMEFIELDYGRPTKITRESMDLWKSCGYTPKGFRLELGSKSTKWKISSSQFDWVGHEEHNKGINWGCHFFEGCDGINEPESLSLYGDTFMFQSHINGTHNDNVWNEENFLHFERVVEYLLSEYELQFLTISEIK